MVRDLQNVDMSVDAGVLGLNRRVAREEERILTVGNFDNDRIGVVLGIARPPRCGQRISIE